jgi:hypothetical protein
LAEEGLKHTTIKCHGIVAVANLLAQAKVSDDSKGVETVGEFLTRRMYIMLSCGWLVDAVFASRGGDHVIHAPV